MAAALSALTLLTFYSPKVKKVAIVDKITNRKTIDSAVLNEGAQHFYMDISDPQLMEKALLPDDVVIHLAAQSHVDVSFKNPVFDNHFQCCRHSQPACRLRQKKV